MSSITGCRTPQNCGSSIYHTGTPICRLESAPCPLMYREGCTECVLDKQERALHEFAKKFWGVNYE